MSDKPLIPEIRNIPEQPVRSKRVIMTDFPKGLSKLVSEILGEIRATGQMPAGAPILIYYDDEYNPERVDVEVSWPVDDASSANGTMPAIQAAYYLHVGPYSTLEAVCWTMMEWITANGYRPSGPMREAYFNDPKTTPAEQLITEIVIPVQRA